VEHTHPVVHIGETPHEVSVLDFAHLLPEPIQRFTTKGVYGGEQQHLSFIQGSGHGGSHAHLVHEFLTSIAEDREPFPNARKAANWTCVGILAHQSALKGGEKDQPAGVYLRRLGAPSFPRRTQRPQKCCSPDSRDP